MQAISPQEVVANSPKLSTRLTMVGLDVSGMQEIVFIEAEFGKTNLRRRVGAPEIVAYEISMSALLPEHSPNRKGSRLRGRDRAVDHELPGSRPIESFTAFWNRCLQPRYFSVVSIDTCPRRSWICSNSPPAWWRSRAGDGYDHRELLETPLWG